MSWVWKNGPENGTERMLLLALADHCDDAGHAYPSMAGLAQKACVTERGARQIMRRLEADGWVKTRIGGGRGGKSQYHILMENPERQTGNEKPGMPNPEPESAKPGTPLPETRNGGSPEPSVTIIEPSIRETRKRARKVGIEPDAVLSQQFRDIASNLTDAEASAQFIRFRDSAIANGRSYADWTAAWRNWLTSPYFKPITMETRHAEPAGQSSRRVSAFLRGAQR
jgi:hypothetical protein